MKRLLLIALLLLVGIASATPTTGVATDITSNGFNSTGTVITGTDCWGTWGDIAGGENWNTPNFTATAGTATIVFLGAPIYGGETVFFQVCDLTGCGNERTATIATITPMPATTYGIFMKNITNSRFNPLVISTSIQNSYSTVAPFIVVIGIALVFFMIGIWTRTRSVRLIAILGIIIAPFVMLGDQGLYLGVPSIGVLIMKGLLAAGLSGILLSFMRR